MSNFYFLEKRFPDLQKSVEKAEKLMYSDLEMSTIMARKSLEQLIKWIVDNKIQKNTKNISINSALSSPEFKNIVPPNILNKMYLVKNLGNKAVHENSEIKQSTVNILIEDLFIIFTWFFSEYGYVKSPVNKLNPIHSAKNSDFKINNTLSTQNFNKDSCTANLDNELLNNGVWVDRKHNLMWARISIGQKWENGRHQGSATWVDWRKAENLCKQLILGGFTDWRLPTIQELARLKQQNKIGYFCPPEALIKPTLNNWGFYWSCSKIGSEIIQGVNFDQGCFANYNYLDYEGHVRAVRNIYKVSEI